MVNSTQMMLDTWLSNHHITMPSTLLTNRMKYVSGDQSMKVDSFGGKEILYSVRYGKDIMSADQIRGVETIKHSGLLTLITNDSNF